MAKFSEIKASFESKLLAEYQTTNVVFDNTTYKPGNSSWVRATLIPTITENAALGGLSKRYRGIFMLQVFVSLNAGTKEAYQIAEELESIFSNKTFDEVVCYASEIVRIGNEGKGWYQLNVRVPFWSHEPA